MDRLPQQPPAHHLDAKTRWAGACDRWSHPTKTPASSLSLAAAGTVLLQPKCTISPATGSRTHRKCTSKSPS